MAQSSFVHLTEDKPYFGDTQFDHITRTLDLLAITNYAVEYLYSNNSVALAQQLWILYKQNPTFSRVINQFEEQSFADAYVIPQTRNEGIQDRIQEFWVTNKWTRKNHRAFKQFLISGEHWVYMPKTRVRGRSPVIKARILTPWDVSQVEGYEPEDWESASYSKVGETIKLNPQNTCYVPHDALFDTLRGVSPFSSMYFSIMRYHRWLEGRERINKVAGNVVGHMHFDTPEDAGRTLGWKKDADGNYIPESIKMPKDGTIVITAGEDATFQILTPQVRGGEASDDGQAFYNQTIEASRLPEYFSGNGNNVNVATARVQYPVAVRAIMALRDEYSDAVQEMIRLYLRILADAGEISDEWTVTNADESTSTETPETATIELSWPQMRELEFKEEFEAMNTLHDKGLLRDEYFLRQLGYDPDLAIPTGDEAAPPSESIRQTALEEVKALLRKEYGHAFADAPLTHREEEPNGA